MSVGHIKLDGRDYLLESVRSYRKYPVNQMAPKVGQGMSEYRDLTSWDAWIVSNWQEGVGQKATDEGVLYAEADTRVPNQIILPPKLNVSDGLQEVGDATDGRYLPVDVPHTIVVGQNGVPKVSIYMNKTGTLNLVWFYMQTQVGVTVEVWTADANGLPDTLLDSGVISPVSNDPGFRWYKAAILEALAGDVCFVIYPTHDTDAITLAGGEAYVGAVTGTFDGSTWSVTTDLYPLFLTDLSALGVSVTDVVRFNGTTYMAAGNQLYSYDESGGNWAAVGAARGDDITDLTVWGDTLYIGLGDSTNHDTMDTSEVYTNASVPGRIFYAGGGFLWRAVGNELYYMGEGGAWSDAIVCGGAQFSIRGITELDGDVYVATDAGVLLIAPGDIARAAIPFGGADSANGVDLLTHQAAMYMTAHGQYLQASSGAVRNIWTVRKDEFPTWAQGRIIRAERMVNWPVVLLSADSASGFDSVWAWQETGWHHLLQLPQGVDGTCVRYDADLSRLWVGTSNGMVFWVYVPNHIVNPYYDSAYEYAGYGWLETDWFAGGVLEAQKDIESVYLRCRNMTNARTISVYWQDDTSEGEVLWVDEEGNNIGEGADVVGETEVTWSFLGTFDTDRQEQFWDIDELRPNTKEIRLGFLLHTGGGGETPKMEAWRLKYHMMVRDWYGWDLPLAVSGTEEAPQQMLDGETNPYTAEEQIAHLDSLVQQVPPLRFVDLDGVERIVKINNASFSPAEVAYWGGRLHMSGTYTLQLEEMRHG